MDEVIMSGEREFAEKVIASLGIARGLKWVIAVTDLIRERAEAEHHELAQALGTMNKCDTRQGHPPEAACTQVEATARVVEVLEKSGGEALSARALSARTGATPEQVAVALKEIPGVARYGRSYVLKVGG